MPAGIEIWANRSRVLSEIAGTQFITSCCEICALCKHLGLKVISGQPVDWRYTLVFQPKFPLKSQIKKLWINIPIVVHPAISLAKIVGLLSLMPVLCSIGYCKLLFMYLMMWFLYSEAALCLTCCGPKVKQRKLRSYTQLKLYVENLSIAQGKFYTWINGLELLTAPQQKQEQWSLDCCVDGFSLLASPVWSSFFLFRGQRTPVWGFLDWNLLHSLCPNAASCHSSSTCLSVSSRVSVAFIFQNGN